MNNFNRWFDSLNDVPRAILFTVLLFGWLPFLMINSLLSFTIGMVLLIVAIAFAIVRMVDTREND